MLRTVPVRLRDGTSVGLRPLTPDDKQLMEAAFARLSARSRRLRFLTPMSRLSPEQLAYLTELDFVDHLAWGAIHDGEGIGVARMVRTADRTAEVAVTVVDQFQGRGLGNLLVELLAALAPGLGIDRFEFVVLAENGPMLGLLARWHPRTEVEDGLVLATVEVASIPVDRIEIGAVVELSAERRLRLAF